MRYGIYLNPQTPGRADDRRVLTNVLGQVDYAVARGFDSVWLTEHHFTGYNVYSDPLILAAALSQRQPGVQIGFSLAVAPLHHPIRFATQCNLLDQLTGGNLIVGLGSGGVRDESAGYGTPRDERREMTDEFTEILLQAWTAGDEGFRYDGRYWRGQVNGRILPSSVQQPHPLIAYGTVALDRLERVGRMGWVWLVSSIFSGSRLDEGIDRYWQGLRASGLDSAAQQRVFDQSAYVLRPFIYEPGEDWRDEIATNIDLYAKNNVISNASVAEYASMSAEERAERHKKSESQLFPCTADQLIDHLRPFAERGIGTFMGWFNWGDLPDHLVKRSIDRFVRDVAPAINAVRPVAIA